jgi:hypothetical protein
MSVGFCCTAAKEVQCHKQTKNIVNEVSIADLIFLRLMTCWQGHLVRLDDAFRHFPMRDFAIEQD